MEEKDKDLCEVQEFQGPKLEMFSYVWSFSWFLDIYMEIWAQQILVLRYLYVDGKPTSNFNKYPLGNDHIAGWNIPIFNRVHTS